MFRAVIKGCGICLPEQVVSNDALQARGLDTSDAWISQRTGIRSRHIAEKGETSASLATIAARHALENAGIPVDQVDAVIVATTTPDNTLPSVATRVQGNLGMAKGFAFDVQAVCSGFIYALTVANNFIAQGQAKTVLVIGAEVLSRLLDWGERETCVLFGDGAGALVLQAQEGAGTKDDQGIISTHLHSDGRLYDSLKTDGGVGTTQTVGAIRMDGKDVFRHAVTNLVDVAEEALAFNAIKSEEIDWFVPHQANLRIIEGTAKKLKVPFDRVVVTIQDHANTSAASIPLALATAVFDGRIKRGNLLLLNTMGGGFTWGAAVVRF